MKDIMLDLETLGTKPGCAILAIGATLFDEFGVGLGFYRDIHVPDWNDSLFKTPEGFVKEQGTIDWWNKQTPEAREVLTSAAPHWTTARAILAFTKWVEAAGPDVRVWGNGADFDNPILATACHILDLPVPWNAYNGRCYRTVKNGFKDVKLKRVGTHHNALDDARSQAQHLVNICQKRDWRLA